MSLQASHYRSGIDNDRDQPAWVAHHECEIWFGLGENQYDLYPVS